MPLTALHIYMILGPNGRGHDLEVRWAGGGFTSGEGHKEFNDKAWLH